VTAFASIGDRRRNTLSSFTGEFTRPAQEAAFRSSLWPDWHRRIRVVVGTGVAAFLVTALTDYLLLSAGLAFSLIIAARLLVASYGVGFLVLAGRRHSPLFSDLGLLIFLVLLVSAFLGMVAARPDGLRYSAPACVLILCVFYAMPMTRMWITLTSAFYLSLGMLAVAAWIKHSPAHDVGVSGVQLLAANLIGFFIARRLHQDARQAWINQQSLQQREREQRLLASLSSQFLGLRSDQLDDAITQAFKSICEHSGSDRAYLMEFDPQYEQARMTHEWCAEGIPKTRPTMQDVPAGLMPWASLKLQRGEIVQADRVHDLPPEASAERDLNLAQGVQSFLCVPLSHEGLLLGMIGLDRVRQQRNWDADTVSMLRFIGQVIFNALRRNQAEVSLRSRESQLQALTTLSPVGIFQTDADGYCQYNNERWLQMTGLQKETALGSRWRQALHPDDTEWVFAAWNVAVAAKAEFDEEYRYQRPDGSIIWVHGRARPQFHADGHVLGFIGTIDDITERKQAQIELEQRARLDQCVNELTVGFVRHGGKDTDVLIQRALAEVGLFAGSDRSAYFTIDTEKSDISCTHLWLRPEVQAQDLALQHIPLADLGWAVPRILRGEIISVPRIAALPLDAIGEKRKLDANSVKSLLVVPILSAGQVTSFITLTAVRAEMHWGSDITLLLRIAGEIILNALQRREAQQSQQLHIRDLEDINLKLEQRSEELQRLAYVASHDLQEPLRIVSSFSSLLAQKYRGQIDGRADEYIGYITEAAARLQRLINDLLTYTRMDNQPRALVNCDMNEIAQVVLANLAESTHSLGARIDCGQLPLLNAEPLQMIHLLQHLVANALRFHGSDPPHIEIRAQRTDFEWLLSVADNGIGIDPRHAERVFEIFQRLHTNDRYPGTGIGLPVCRRIVERHGGRIWVEPNSPQGSVFRWTLPAILSDESGQSVESRHVA
jgi:PAS domain S-box-containing protein